MRAEFAKAMISLFEERDDLVFITADLGYMALEELAEKYGERFLNVGVAEQNAVSMAAGLAREGQLPVADALGITEQVASDRRTTAVAPTCPATPISTR